VTKLLLEKSNIKFLLLEGIHQTAVDHLKAAGYSHIEYHKGVLDKGSLKEAVRDAHFIGIRSRTDLCKEIFASAKKLISVGCFCIGINHVDLNAAAKKKASPFLMRLFQILVQWQKWHWVNYSSF